MKHVAFNCDKFGDSFTELIVISVTCIAYVSAVGETGVQSIGNHHDSYYMGHGSWVMVTWVMGQFTDGSDGSWFTKCDPMHCTHDVQ